MDSLSNRYARALWSIASEENRIEEYQSKVQSIDHLCRENPRFMRILSSSFISKSEKHQVIDKTFAPLDNRHIISFLKVIVDHDRVSEWHSILQEFHSLCNESLGISEGIAYSVVPLDKQQLQEVTRVISSSMGKHVELKNRLDTRLLGGVKVVVGDRVFDGSLLSKVENLKQNLKQGK